MKKIYILILLCLGLCGCSSTGVVPMDKDTYMIAKKTCFYGRPVGVEAAVYREANEFCAIQNKKVEIVKCDIKSTRPFVPGSVFLQFRCVSDNDNTSK